MLYQQIKYAKILGVSLDRFKIKNTNPFLAWCRCPLCGDSKKSKIKRRGFFYAKNQKLFYKCFNCSICISFTAFLKRQNSYLYQQYLLENFSETKLEEEKDQYEPKKIYLPNLNKLIDIESLPQNHPAINYLKNRKIPIEFYSKFKYITNFVKWVSEILEKEIKINEHPRLIIPFYDESHKIFAYQARAFGNEQPKYFTIKLDSEKEKIYGLNSVNISKPVYVLEGPIDSMFIDNSIAICDANYTTNNYVKSLPNKIIVPDQEPRNKEIVDNIEKVIKNGWNICLIQEKLPGKDINDWIKSGMTKKHILDLINNNVYSGLEASLIFYSWKRV